MLVELLELDELRLEVELELDDPELLLELLVLELDWLLVRLLELDDSSSIVRIRRRSPVAGPGN